MDILKVVNWIGVFALAMGSLISMVQGGLVSSLFGVLLLSFLVSSLLPLPVKLAVRVSPRWHLLHKTLMRTIVLVGCWILAGTGGWEFVPAAVVLSGSLLIWPGIEMIIKRRRNKINMINGINGINGMNGIVEVGKPDIVVTSSNDNPNSSASIPETSPPPLYTSTVKIIQDDCSKADRSQCPVIQTPPLFNV